MYLKLIIFFRDVKKNKRFYYIKVLKSYKNIDMDLYTLSFFCTILKDL